MTSGKAGDVIAFTKRHAFIAAGGGYVLHKDDKAYQFPLSVVDLRTGLDLAATLTVPLTDRVPLPQSNYSQTGDDQFKAMGPHLLGVTFLEAHGTMLRVCLGMEGRAAGVEFDLSKSE